MASLIRSDASLSTRFLTARIGPAASTADRLTNTKQVTQFSAVTGNGARDDALQINGHVAEKLNNFNFKTLIISCHCEVARAVSNKKLASLPAAVPAKPHFPAPVEGSAFFNAVDPAEIPSLRKEKKNVTVFSKATGQPDSFCVIFPRRVRDNFISLKLVNRLGLRKHFETASVTSITWNSTRLSSTGDFVNLSLPMQDNVRCIPRRFYIVENCPFDMVLGKVAAGYALH
ncbi:uncharacterized protein EKO05_0006844 [Ascochyta rabiei]|uniref:uncharacterized protein n=1 Tax=Didymella rabiei TaxID=5454 RepID=UPI002209746E|nr:uncharacterized protein EKO05_0006844 [Ascochyta rabiei]UPX16445.1 hypothetical protein EKO05_0006844 [Ascochyta rabiei]